MDGMEWYSDPPGTRATDAIDLIEQLTRLLKQARTSAIGAGQFGIGYVSTHIIHVVENDG
jgi:hypothetical protein